MSHYRRRTMREGISHREEEGGRVEIAARRGIA